MRGFVFAVIFIIVFSTLLTTIPTGLQGPGDAADTVIPVDPSLLSGFDDTENYTKSAFSGANPYFYDYSLGARDWSCMWLDQADDEFYLIAKVYFWGFWLGHTDPCNFFAPNGTTRGIGLSIDEIEGDAVDGAARYSMLFTTTGDDAGSFIVYWNTTLYADPQDAHDNDVLYLVHGVGFSATVGADIGSLLVSLLFLQLPDVPVLVNMFLAVPIWASIIFVLWFVIKETLPFV